MNKPFAFWLASGAVIFAMTVAGCEKRDQPVPLGRAPAAAPAETGGVASAPRGEASPAISATGEAKTTGRQESGEFF